MKYSHLLSLLLASVIPGLQFHACGADVDVGSEIQKLQNAIYRDPSVVPPELADVERDIAHLSPPALRGTFFIRAAEAIGDARMDPNVSTPIILRLAGEGLACSPNPRDAAEIYTTEGNALLALEENRIANRMKEDSPEEYEEAVQNSMQRWGWHQLGEEIRIQITDYRGIAPEDRTRIAQFYLHAVALIVESFPPGEKMEFEDLPATPTHVKPTVFQSNLLPGKYREIEPETKEEKDVRNAAEKSAADYNAAIHHNAMLHRYHFAAVKLTTIYSASETSREKLTAIAAPILKNPESINSLLDYMDANRPKNPFDPDTDLFALLDEDFGKFVRIEMDDSFGKFVRLELPVAHGELHHWLAQRLLSRLSNLTLRPFGIHDFATSETTASPPWLTGKKPGATDYGSLARRIEDSPLALKTEFRDDGSIIRVRENVGHSRSY
ncbi:MAG: hypothetical protein WCD79_18125 [Chthoniobacteraceae bacterium]